MARRGWATALLVGLLLGGWLAVSPAAQGTFTAQITRALRAYGLTSPLVFQGTSVAVASTGSIGFSSTTSPSGTPDVLLVRDAANVLAQRNGTNAQTFNVYNTYTNASNYERGFIRATATQVIIGSERAGTGVARDLVMQSAGSLYFGGAALWYIPTAGQLIPNLDNSYDLGLAGIRVRTGYFGTSVVSPILQGSGTGVSVANVGANSCGTTTATIAGNQLSGVITVGTVAGTQCRVTFSTAAPVARDCTVTDSTTTIATRATAVSTTTHDFLGAFVAGDLVTYVCTVR